MTKRARLSREEKQWPRIPDNVDAEIQSQQLWKVVK